MKCVINEGTNLDAPLYTELPLADICQQLNATFSPVEPADSSTAGEISFIKGISSQRGEEKQLILLTDDPGRFLCN